MIRCKVVWTKEALIDMETIFDFISMGSIRAATILINLFIILLRYFDALFFRLFFTPISLYLPRIQKPLL